MSARPGVNYWSPPARRPHPMTALQSSVAACLTKAMTDKEIARALGKNLKHTQSMVRDLRAKYEARNRVALALTLDREMRGEA